MRHLLAFFLFLGIATIAQAEEEMRTWTSTGGIFTVEATFVELEEGSGGAKTVVLESQDGKTHRVPLAS